MIRDIKEHSAEHGVRPLCKGLGVPPATYYRHQKPKREAPKQPPSNALTGEERQAVLNELHSERFMNRSPSEVFWSLLDEGKYLCAARTMYRILTDNNEVKERRNITRHPKYTAPELVARGPNQVWSWDITKLKSQIAFEYYHLYVVLDIFSRRVVGWLLAPYESADLACKLLKTCYEREQVKPGQVTIHADNGPAMIAKSTKQLLAQLEAQKSHSRPYTSNDNPFSESQFKTMKYCPEFPERFKSEEHARAFCRGFFEWYNVEHRHSGLNYLTAEEVHNGTASKRVEERQRTMEAAYRKHPKRFSKGKPCVRGVPSEVWINKPKQTFPLKAEGVSSEVEVGVLSLPRIHSSH